MEIQAKVETIACSRLAHSQLENFYQMLYLQQTYQWGIFHCKGPKLSKHAGHSAGIFVVSSVLNCNLRAQTQSILSASYLKSYSKVTNYQLTQVLGHER